MPKSAVPFPVPINPSFPIDQKSIAESRIVNPSISVIIPAYNRFEMLVYVIRSILAQTTPVLEIVVVDDGSLDETPARLSSLLDKLPEWKERVHCYSQANQGQSAAMNYGLSLAKGEWIAFAAHDDPWLPWKLEWQLRAIHKYGSESSLCFTDAWFMNNPFMKQTTFQFAGFKSSNPLGVIHDPARLIVADRHPVWLQTVLARADLLHRAGGLDPNLRYSEDHDLLFRAALLTPFCYVSMPMVLIDRSPADLRHVGAGENWHKVEFCLQMDQYRYEKQLSLSSGLPRNTRNIIRRNLRAIHSSWANLHLRQRNYTKARLAAQTAIRCHLTIAAILKWMLIATAPALARSLSIARDQGALRHDRTSWLNDSSVSKIPVKDPTNS